MRVFLERRSHRSRRYLADHAGRRGHAGMLAQVMVTGSEAHGIVRLSSPPIVSAGIPSHHHRYAQIASCSRPLRRIVGRRSQICLLFHTFFNSSLQFALASTDCSRDTQSLLPTECLPYWTPRLALRPTRNPPERRSQHSLPEPFHRDRLPLRLYLLESHNARIRRVQRRRASSRRAQRR